MHVHVSVNIHKHDIIQADGFATLHTQFMKSYRFHELYLLLFCAFFTLVIHRFCSLLGIQKVLLLPHNSRRRLPLRNNYFPTYKSQKRLNHLLLLFLNMRALE